MTDYEELAERCRDLWWMGSVEPILAEVYRTLENITPEMLLVSDDDMPEWNWLAMLRASPLAPPKE